MVVSQDSSNACTTQMGQLLAQHHHGVAQQQGAVGLAAQRLVQERLKRVGCCCHGPQQLLPLAVGQRLVAIVSASADET